MLPVGVGMSAIFEFLSFPASFFVVKQPKYKKKIFFFFCLDSTKGNKLTETTLKSKEKRRKEKFVRQYLANQISIVAKKQRNNELKKDFMS